MSEPSQKRIDEGRAAVLLGVTREQLRQLCEKAGLGCEESGETSGHRVFTYEELYRLCRLVVPPAV